MLLFASDCKVVDKVDMSIDMRAINRCQFKSTKETISIDGRLSWLMNNYRVTTEWMIWYNGGIP